MIQLTQVKTSLQKENHQSPYFLSLCSQEAGFQVHFIYPSHVPQLLLVELISFKGAKSCLCSITQQLLGLLPFSLQESQESTLSVFCNTKPSRFPEQYIYSMYKRTDLKKTPTPFMKDQVIQISFLPFTELPSSSVSYDSFTFTSPPITCISHNLHLQHLSSPCTF